jgi:hypothetical protein
MAHRDLVRPFSLASVLFGTWVNPCVIHGVIRMLLVVFILVALGLAVVDVLLGYHRTFG